MAVYTVRSLPEEPGRPARYLSAGLLLLSVLFAVFSGGYFSYLVMCEYRVSRYLKVRRILLVDDEPLLLESLERDGTASPVRALESRDGTGLGGIKTVSERKCPEGKFSCGLCR